MEVENVLKELMNISSDNLPQGKDGDGVSRQHFQGAKSRLFDEHLPALKNAESSLDKAEQELVLSLNELLKFVAIHENEELKDLLLKHAVLIDKIKNERKKHLKILTKLHRWIGWFQGVLASFKIVSLSEMKKMNFKN